eukprot:NODE_127_length_18646_cov_0.421632.p2 type:complete len:764 gc:universal NODE_127_length_18646_cov_0.421632:12799-10508(-)
MSKKDDISFSLPDKSYLLQNAKMFHQQINSRKCRLLISKCLLYLNNPPKNHYFNLSPEEQTQLFFGASKLFNSKEYQLRQIVYILMMELTSAKDTIIMTNLLTKDIAGTFEELFGKPMNTISLSKEEGPFNQNLIHTSNALKALSILIDPSLLQAFERFYMTCLVDKSPIIASSSICSAYILYPYNKDLIKKWSNLIQDQATSYDFTSYHAISTLYLLKQQDPISILKLCLSSISSINSPWSTSMLINIIRDECINNYTNLMSNPFVQLFEYLVKALNSKYDMIILAACNALTKIAIHSHSTNNPLTQAQILPLITQSSLYLSSKLPLKFATLQNLNKLSNYYPTAISAYNIDLEVLVSDPNTSIATFAITTLLKTGNENSVDRLILQIQSTINTLNEEFKIIIVDAISKLSLKFTNKSSLFVTFLNSVLREEGNYNFKTQVISALQGMLTNNSKNNTSAANSNMVSSILSSFCEFIEDCEYTTLNVRVLYIISQYGPSQVNPQQYIRYIYNRIILESSNVRAAAVKALYMFGCLPQLKKRITKLLMQCSRDLDHETRERSLFYLLKLSHDELPNTSLVMDLTDLDDKLTHLSGTVAESLNNVLMVPKAIKKPPTLQQQQEQAKVQPLVNPVSVTLQDKLPPQLQSLAPLLWTSSESSLLSEVGMEFEISWTVHVFTNDAIVIEYHIVNTLELDVVQCVVELQSADLRLKISIPLDCASKQEGISWSGYSKQPGQLVLGVVNAQLKCKMVEDGEAIDESIQVI